jgi:adenosylcobinamide-GDP ribazoletransferase
MSFGMFCALPQPSHVWDEEAVNLVLPCLPLVGVCIGVLWWSAAKLMFCSGIPIPLASAVVALTPFFASGFLHLDGYMDTSDAVLSCRPLEDKLRILKDPHVGAFAVIMLAVLFVVQFATACAVVEKESHVALLIIPVLSRSCAALSLLCLKPISQSVYAKMFRQNTTRAHVLFLLCIAVSGIALACFLARVSGLIVAVSVIVGFTGAMAWAYRNLKGISGDLAGFALTAGELCGLVAMAVI